MSHSREFPKRRVLAAAAFVALISAGLFTFSWQSGQNKIPARQSVQKVIKTILKVGKPIPDGTDWVSSMPLDGPSVYKFYWTTKETGATSARWVVTSEIPYGRPGANVLKSGDLTEVPAPDKTSPFNIDFRPFLPKEGPKAPYVANYYVTLIPLDLQKRELTPSSLVKLTYQAQGEQTIFGDDMGQNTDTYAQAILTKAYNELKTKFELGDPLGKIQAGPGLAAYRLFSTPAGNASIEVVRTMPDPTIYVCVPRKSPVSGSAIAHQWFMYTTGRPSGKIVPHVQGDQYPPPDATPPVLTDTGAWAAYSSYNCVAGDDPPHWTPILIAEDGTSIASIHSENQTLAIQRPARAAIENVRIAVKSQDLTDRAAKLWQHVKLCGYIEDASWPGGDLGTDHAMGYTVGGLTPFGPIGEICNPDIWPGIDWDMAVIPDPAYNYLASDVRSTLKVEIEHFALGSEEYWPKTGEWLQTIGRWVTDNGHDCYTEIHPPELMVATQPFGDNAYRARVTATGAWTGAELTFVVNPPPRPSASARLKYWSGRLDGSPGYDRQDNCELIIEPRGPQDNPNYLFCRVRETATADITLYNTGVVGMTGDRGLQCAVIASWDETIAGVSGTVRAQNEPARTATVFYRGLESPNAGWRQVVTDSQGRYSVPGLAVGKSYWFRPAGSGWNFANVPVKYVVKDKDNVLNFTATHEGYATGASGSLKAYAAQGRKFGGLRGAVLKKAGTAPSPAEAGAEMIQSMLIAYEYANGLYGVLGNALGYKEGGVEIFRLRGLAGWDNQPILDPASAYSVDGKTSPPSITVNGIATMGVAGAKIRAHLLLGNPTVGYHTVQTIEGRTGYNGVAGLHFSAGSHVEEAMVTVEVLENPYNPWFLPKITGSSHLFMPAKDGADLRAGGSKPYAFKLTALEPNIADATKALGAEGQDFFNELKTMEKVSAQIFKQAAKEKRIPRFMKPSPKVFKEVKK